MNGDVAGKNIILTMGDFFSALGAASPSPELKGILQGDLFKDLAAYFFPGTTTSAPRGQGVTWFLLDIVVKDMISHMLPADVVPRYKVGAACGPKSGCGSAGKNMFQGQMLQELLYQMIPNLAGSGPGSTWSDVKAAGTVMKENM